MARAALALLRTGTLVKKRLKGWLIGGIKRDKRCYSGK
jgi:hypothetical protein